MAPVHVFFFRGLSTYGQDNARLSFLNFGPVYKHLKPALEKRGLIFHPVLGMGSGTLVEVGARAADFLRAHPVWRNMDAEVHVLAHSAGGLAARLALAKMAREEGAREAASLLTVASPHGGSRLARICIDMPVEHRGSALLLRSLGYNIARRRGFFEELTAENVSRLFVDFPAEAASVRQGSIVCAAPRAEWCRPLRTLYRLPAMGDFDVLSDGFVERDSQVFGEVIAEMKIDHLQEMGLFASDRKFDRLCDTIADFFVGGWR